MKQTLFLRISFIIISLLILLTYASEISFMPNYNEKPDKWHLLFPMLLFYPALFIIICMAIFKKNIKSEKIEILLFPTVALVSFAMLNDPKGNSQTIGFLVLSIISLIAIVRLLILQSRNSSR